MIRIVRLGTPRAPDEGLRLGTVRRPPRGVPKTDYARRDFYDVWVPELAPSPALFSWVKRPEARRLIELLVALSARTNFSVGCYCEVESRCHRSLLRELFMEAGAKVS